MKEKNLAVITARSGSKGLKDKNIKDLCGRPLMAYTIEAAVKSEMFACIHLSTDSDVYARIGRQYGADIPFLRSEILSSDTAGSFDVVKWVVEEYRKRGREFDTVTLLQPTSPLRDAQDIRNAFDFYDKKAGKAAVSVCEMEHSPLWSNTLPDDFSMENFESKEISSLPRQQLPVYYRMNGAIYITQTEHLFREETIYDKECYAFIMDKMHSVDIDGEMDFKIAEVIYKTRLED